MNITTQSIFRLQLTLLKVTLFFLVFIASFGNNLSYHVQDFGPIDFSPPQNTIKSCSRREFGRIVSLSALTASLSWSAKASSATGFNANKSLPPSLQQGPVSFDEALVLIRDQTPVEFIRAVKGGGKFLYRGEGVARPTVVAHVEDLFDEETYGSAAAVGYFRALDAALRCGHGDGGDVGAAAAAGRARPSNSHISVGGDRGVAAEWGGVCSIWPLGQELHYTWFEKQQLIYDDNLSEKEAAPGGGGPLAAAAAAAAGAALRWLRREKGLKMDTNLQEALTSGHEILMTTSLASSSSFCNEEAGQQQQQQLSSSSNNENMYLAIPESFDNRINEWIATSYP